MKKPLKKPKSWFLGFFSFKKPRFLKGLQTALMCGVPMMWQRESGPKCLQERSSKLREKRQNSRKTGRQVKLWTHCSRLVLLLVLLLYYYYYCCCSLFCFIAYTRFELIPIQLLLLHLVRSAPTQQYPVTSTWPHLNRAWPGGLTNYCPSVLDTFGWVLWTVKIVPNMTYNLFGGTLNPTLPPYIQQQWNTVCFSTSLPVSTYAVPYGFISPSLNSITSDCTVLTSCHSSPCFAGLFYGISKMVTSVPELLYPSVSTAAFGQLLKTHLFSACQHI